MTSRAERKRRKKRFITLAGGEQVEQKATGLPRVHAKGRDEDPTGTVVKARIGKMMAAGVQNPERHALSDMAGCEVGRALLADDFNSDEHAEEERADMWRAVCHIRRTWVAYGRAIGAPNRYAQCLRILLPAEQFIVSADAPAFDDRPQAERDRSAVAAYMRTHGWLMKGSARDLQACIGAVVDDQPGHDWEAVKRALGLVVRGLAGTKG